MNSRTTVHFSYVFIILSPFTVVLTLIDPRFTVRLFIAFVCFITSRTLPVNREVINHSASILVHLVFTGRMVDGGRVYGEQERK